METNFTNIEPAWLKNQTKLTNKQTKSASTETQSKSVGDPKNDPKKIVSEQKDVEDLDILSPSYWLNLFTNF